MKKSLKRLSSLLLIVIMIISMSITSWGQSFSIEDFPKHLERMKLWDTVILMLDSSKAYVDLTEVAIDDTNKDIKPLLKNNKTLVPVRFISEALGAEVDWNEKIYSDAIKSMLEELPEEYDYSYHEVIALAAQLGLEEEALKYVDKLIEIILKSDDPYTELEYNIKLSKAYALKAYLLERLDRYEDAIVCYSKAIEVDPNNYLLYNLKGSLLYITGLYEEAIRMFDKSISLYSEPIYGYGSLYSAYKGKAYALAELGKADEIVKTYHELIELGIDDVEWIYKFAFDLWKMGLHEEAIELFDKAASKNNDSVNFYVYKGKFLYEAREFERSIRVLDEVLKKDKDNINANKYKHLSLRVLGKYDEALAIVNYVMDIMPKCPILHVDKGVTLYLMGDYEGAIKEYDKAIQLDPFYDSAYADKAIVLWAKGEPDESIKVVAKAVELGVNTSNFYNNIAWYLLEDGQYEEAFDYINTSIELFEDEVDSFILDTRGWILFRLGEYDEAMQDFELAVELDEHIESIRSSTYGMACIYAAKNQNEQAIEYLTKALVLDSSYIKSAMEEDVFRIIKNTDEFKALVKKYNR